MAPQGLETACMRQETSGRYRSDRGPLMPAPYADDQCLMKENVFSCPFNGLYSSSQRKARFSSFMASRS